MASGPTFATIRLAAVRANFALAKELAGERAPVAVIKADAYGHGAVRVAQALAEAGCRHFAVATVDEAVTLRGAGISQPVLILGGAFDVEAARAVVALDLTPAIHDAGQVEWLAAAAGRRSQPLDVEVEVDTGMRRMGIPSGQALRLLERVDREPSLRLSGVYTHLARADEVDLDPTREQLRLFAEVLEEARGRRIDPGRVHVLNSAALLASEPLRDALPSQTAVRPGLMLYGVRPAPHLEGALQPAMTLQTRVVSMRSVSAGEPVGYSAEFRAARDTRLATLPIGYEDGLPIAASRRGVVLIRGRRLPIAGRVSMDYTSVDVGDAPVETGDEVIVFGGAQNEVALPIEVAAEAAGTIPYELLVRVGRRVSREFEA